MTYQNRAYTCLDHILNHIKAEMIKIPRLHVVSFCNNNEYCPNKARHRRIVPRYELPVASQTHELGLKSPEVEHKTEIYVEEALAPVISGIF